MLRSIPNKSAMDFNTGSIRDILWVPIEYIDSFYKDYDAGFERVDITSTVLNTVTEWFTVKFIRQTAKWSTEDATGPNGPYEKVKLSFKIAKHYDFRVPDFGDMREREFCVVAIDTNGIGRIVGEINLQNERKGMRFFKSQSSGETYPNRNEYDCYFYTESAVLITPAFYETPPPVEPPIDPWGGGIPVVPPVD